MKRQNKYNKKSTVQICLRLNKKTDADIIEYIELLKKNNISVNGTIKNMFRYRIKILKDTSEIHVDKVDKKVAIKIKEIVEKYGGEKSEGDK